MLLFFFFTFLPQVRDKLDRLNEEVAVLNNEKIEQEDLIDEEKKKSDADDNKLHNIEVRRRLSMF